MLFDWVSFTHFIHSDLKHVNRNQFDLFDVVERFNDVIQDKIRLFYFLFPPSSTLLLSMSMSLSIIESISFVLRLVRVRVFLFVLGFGSFSIVRRFCVYRPNIHGYLAEFADSTVIVVDWKWNKSKSDKRYAMNKIIKSLTLILWHYGTSIYTYAMLVYHVLICRTTQNAYANSRTYRWRLGRFQVNHF